MRRLLISALSKLLDAESSYNLERFFRLSVNTLSIVGISVYVLECDESRKLLQGESFLPKKDLNLKLEKL